MKLFFIRNKENKYLRTATGGFTDNLQDALYYHRIGPARSAVSWQFNNHNLILDILEYTVDINQAIVINEEARILKQKNKRDKEKELAKIKSKEREKEYIKEQMVSLQNRYNGLQGI